jgi:hypothetical protein
VRPDSMHICRRPRRTGVQFAPPALLQDEWQQPLIGSGQAWSRGQGAAAEPLPPGHQLGFVGQGVGLESSGTDWLEPALPSEYSAAGSGAGADAPGAVEADVASSAAEAATNAMQLQGLQARDAAMPRVAVAAHTCCEASLRVFFH